MSEPETARPMIRVEPAPTTEELAAIVAAVTATLRQPATTPEPDSRPVSRWARRGRLDAMRGLDQDGQR